MIDVTCEKTGKRSFSSRSDAAKLGSSLRRRCFQRMFTYKCTICKGWHLTKKPPEDVKRLKTIKAPVKGP